MALSDLSYCLPKLSICVYLCAVLQILSELQWLPIWVTPTWQNVAMPSVNNLLPVTMAIGNVGEKLLCPGHLLGIAEIHLTVP